MLFSLPIPKDCHFSMERSKTTTLTDTAMAVWMSVSLLFLSVCLSACCLFSVNLPCLSVGSSLWLCLHFFVIVAFLVRCSFECVCVHKGLIQVYCCQIGVFGICLQISLSSPMSFSTNIFNGSWNGKVSCFLSETHSTVYISFSSVFFTHFQSFPG